MFLKLKLLKNNKRRSTLRISVFEKEHKIHLFFVLDLLDLYSFLSLLHFHQPFQKILYHVIEEIEDESLSFFPCFCAKPETTHNSLQNQLYRNKNFLQFQQPALKIDKRVAINNYQGQLKILLWFLFQIKQVNFTKDENWSKVFFAHGLICYQIQRCIFNLIICGYFFFTVILGLKINRPIFFFICVSDLG